MTQHDPLIGLKNIPELWALYSRQPLAAREGYENWWIERVETKAAHRDCLEAYLAGYQAGQNGQVRRRVTGH
jgi:hypothetical protein